MSRISVIVPTFNRATLVLETIRAVLAQTHPVHEIIVIDDGSTDETRAAVATLPSSIQYVFQENAGKAVALNNGLSRATGDYIWICDDDDLATPNAAKLLVAALEANPSAGFAFGHYMRFLSDPKTGERIVSEPVYWPDLERDAILVALLMDCFIFQNACLVRKSAFDAVGPFRAELIRSQDYEMTIRLVRSFEPVYVPENVFLQRAHQGPRGSARDRFDASRQMEKWLYYDAMFFRDLYDAIPLSRFAPKNSGVGTGEPPERVALLQRACIFWRRKLFDRSLPDLAEAIRANGGTRLTEAEARICGNFIHPKFGCNELLTRPDVVGTLCGLAGESSFGLSVVRAITSSLPWFIRHAFSRGDFKSGMILTGLLLRTHGHVGTAALVGHSLKRRLATHRA
jgi:glycosyltransferase involved in cell wall biosynthesis